MKQLFTSESVSEGHPDKIADQISDAILDAALKQDPNSRIACETLVTTGLVVIAGETTTQAYIDIPTVVRNTIREIGYTQSAYKFSHDSCGIMVTLDEQSPDIAQGVDEDSGLHQEQGAGDQGLMFGYAVRETEQYLNMSLAFSHNLMQTLAQIRKTEPNLMAYLRPDSKSQVTIEYEGKQPKRVDTIVVSTQHDDLGEYTLSKITADIKEYVIPRVIPPHLLDSETVYHINPTGKFIIGGPHGDAGLTGRKIIVDTYGGKGGHGGGAFSGKDPSKVDRSAAYAARHIAKNMVAAGVADEILVQLAYAIGVPEPVSININTYGTKRIGLSDIEIAKVIYELFDLKPKAIIDRLQLKKPIYKPAASYGHMGRIPFTKNNLDFFTWERLDRVEDIRTAFKI